MSRFINVTCQSNLRNGIFITGNKSNNILFEHVAVLDNGACGIREEFSLQNTYLNCVAEANSLTNNNQSRVSFLIDNVNHYFICIRDITTPGVGQNPLNTNFWREFGTAGGEVTDVYPEWSSTKSYLMSFAYALCVAGNASRSVMSGCYAENNQLSIYNNPYSGNGNIIIGGQISNPSSIDSMIYNDRGAITSNKFGTNRPLTDLVIPDNSNLNNPWYLIGGTNLKSGIGYESKGGYLIGNLFANRKNPDGASYKPLYLSYQFIQQYSSFGYRLDTGGENERSPLMFVIKESVEKYPAMYGAARGFTEKDCYSCFLSPTFHRIIDNGAQVAVRYLGFSNNVPTVGNYTKGDFFLNPNSNTNTVRRPIGWRCITSTTSTTPAVWETLHYFQPAEEMVLNTQPASETYSQSQMQNLIDVVNELINKLTAAGPIES